MKVLLLGDSHGDAEFVLRGLRVARRESCDLVFQLGDFGYYPNFPAGVNFLRRVEAGVVEYGTPLYFLDGNHDAMVPLWDEFGLRVQEEDFTQDGIQYVEGCSRGDFIEVRDGIFYAPRGHQWTWGGRTFMALGGAFSINRDHMMPGVEWWEEEEISEDQVQFVLENSAPSIDALLTHDSPRGVDLPALAFRKEHRETIAHRELVLQVVNHVKPKLLVHGHYHSRFGSWLHLNEDHAVRVEGLGANRTAGSDDPWVVLNLEDDL